VLKRLLATVPLLTLGLSGQALAKDEPSKITASAAYLLAPATDEVLWSRNAETQLPVASIAKVMTALVVLTSGSLDQQITIGPIGKVCRDASMAGLHRGDRLTAHALLYALLLPSGCDAAAALAVAYGPGRDRFIERMNEMAEQLGMHDTRFVTPDGLPWPSPGYSTAHDTALLGQAAIRHALLRTVVATRTHHERATHANHAYLWDNTDRLLGSYRGLIGIKTGTTNAAGACFLFAARRHGQLLVGVVLHTHPDTRFAEAARILTWGFRKM
jgi:D-alanyl-D-alanine carboxypeptidase (penicillin-binding protein 5/6)